MRLTNNLMSRNYIENLNTNLKALNNLNDKVSSGRKFSKASEDPAAALKAFQVRKNLSRISLYKTNISDIGYSLNEVESSVGTINDIVKSAVTLVIQGRNGTNNDNNKDVVANSLRSYQEQILNMANAKFSDKYVFGGQAFKEIPFTLGDSGELMYLGQDVDTGTFGGETKYLDIGLGLSTDASGEISPESAFNAANSGAKLLGTGIDENGISNNLYNVIGSIAQMFEDGDLTQIDIYAKKLDSKEDDIMLQYVSVGEKVSFIEYLNTRFEKDEDNATEKQSSIESINTAQAIIDFNSQELAYNACLQMGLKVIQPSLLDYLR